MLRILLVGAGGFAGSVFRYLLSGLVYRFWGNGAVPVGTLAVNITGCFLIGLLGGLTETRQFFSPETRVFLLIGLLGGFTTFSTFGYETFHLMRAGQMPAMLLNVILHVILGVGAVWAGYILARW